MYITTFGFELGFKLDMSFDFEISRQDAPDKKSTQCLWKWVLKKNRFILLKTIQCSVVCNIRSNKYIIVKIGKFLLARDYFITSKQNPQFLQLPTCLPSRFTWQAWYVSSKYNIRRQKTKFVLSFVWQPKIKLSEA